MPISKTDELLAEFAGTHPTHDWTLQRLLTLADMEVMSIGFEISVVLGGRIIRGLLLGERRYATRIDHALDEAIEGYIPRCEPGTPEHEGATAWRDATKGSFLRSQELRKRSGDKDREQLEQIAKEKGVSVDDLDSPDLPDDLAVSSAVAISYRSSLALENAVMLAPPMNREDELGTIRIQIAQIEAWWLNGIADSDPETEPSVDPLE